jgi:hypothetical protein
MFTFMTGARDPMTDPEQEKKQEALARSPLKNSPLAMSILGENLKRDDPLFRVFKKYEKEGLPLEVVEYVPQPFNGDRIYIRPKHRVVEEACRPAPISARFLDVGVPEEICLISIKIRNLAASFDRRSVILKWVSIATRSGT